MTEQWTEETKARLSRLASSLAFADIGVALARIEELEREVERLTQRNINQRGTIEAQAKLLLAAEREVERLKTDPRVHQCLEGVFRDERDLARRRLDCKDHEYAEMKARAEAAEAKLAEETAADRFVRLLEPDEEDRADILNNPEFCAKDYSHAMAQLGAVMELDQKRKAAEAELAAAREQVADVRTEMNARLRATDDRDAARNTEISELRAKLAEAQERLEHQRGLSKSCETELAAERERVRKLREALEQARPTMSRLMPVLLELFDRALRDEPEKVK